MNPFLLPFVLPDIAPPPEDIVSSGLSTLAIAGIVGAVVVLAAVAVFLIVRAVRKK